MPETSKISGTNVSRIELTPASAVGPAFSVVQSDAGSRTEERLPRGTPIPKLTEFEVGYLAGLVDGEGYIFMAYNKKPDHSRPNLRIYCTSKSIIDGACRIMRVNPIPRRDHGNLVGWLACTSGKKAIDVMRIISPYLTDPSKKCRALTCTKLFETAVNIKGRHRSSDVFAHCPLPAKLRTKSSERLDSRVTAEEVAVRSVAGKPRIVAPPKNDVPAETSILGAGWLCGMVDGEGFVHIRYRSDRDSMYPRIRVFVVTKPIIDEAARLMGVNPYARRSHGKHMGWYASVSHTKALRVLQVIWPRLFDESKKCRSGRILDAFGKVGTIHSRLETAEFFGNCPPPCKPRKYGRIINRR